VELYGKIPLWAHTILSLEPNILKKSLALRHRLKLRELHCGLCMLPEHNNTWTAADISMESGRWLSEGLVRDTEINI
jgi:hypothetical protein